MTQPAEQAESPQKVLWNGRSGQTWVEEQALLDRLLQPFEALLVAAAKESGAHDVLDVGCGTGATMLAICRTIGGRCTCVDISEPMIRLARARAAEAGLSAEFVVADAQHHAFPPAAFDLIVSRFGVMFFDDPVAAFANLRPALRPGGSLRAIAWRSAADNPFQTTAERAAAPFLPYLPPRDPDAPGQFGFGDGDRVRRILEASGWREIAVEPIDIACTMTASELETYFTRLGPVGGALPEADAGTRSRILDAVRPAFAPYVQGDTVRFTAACWQIGARN